MPRIERISTFSLVAMLVLALAACDSNSANDDDDDRPFASFRMDVAGDAETSMDGFAFFGEAQDPETGENVFVIYFSETQDVTTQAQKYAFMGRNSGRPAVGSYSIVDLDQEDEDIPNDEFVMVASLGETQAITYLSEGGVLTITESSSSRLEGDFEINASGFDFTDGQELDVTIEGSFDAVGSDDVFLPFVQ